MGKKRIFSLLVGLLLAVGTFADDEPRVTAMEYWLDGQLHERRTVQASSDGRFDFDLDASSLGEGIHTLNYRLQAANGTFGPLLTHRFYRTRPDVATELRMARYWWNDRTDEAVSVTMSGTNSWFDEWITLPDAVRQDDSRGIGCAMFHVQIVDDAGHVSYTVSQEVTDQRPPRSVLDELPYEVTNGRLRLSWSGSDDWSGVKDYTLYVNDGSGDYRAVVTNTTETSYVYENKTDNEWISFYVTARDNRGNVQDGYDARSVYFHYIDVYPPVTTLTVSETALSSGSSVTLSWSGTDDKTGVKTYNVYYAEDDGPFVLWMPGTTATSAAFAGQSGTTYRFAVTATDNNGNVERIDLARTMEVTFY